MDVEALSNALAKMFGDHEQRKRMSAASRERFERVYAHKNTIDRLENHWRQQKKKARPRSPEPDLLSMPMFDTFSHYVTHSVTDTDQVVLSDLGHELLVKKSNYPHVLGMNEVLLVAEIPELMSIARSPQSLGTLAPATAWRRRYTVMWMLKQGLLRWVGGPNE
ncbi:MAG TPA: hypothetical protein EYN66_18490 [Myxococcales bacterium]|nr:hypothetical protein [Myxococcales bacterium]